MWRGKRSILGIGKEDLPLQSSFKVRYTFKPVLKNHVATSVNRETKMRVKRKNLEAGPDSEDSEKLRAQRGGGKQVNRNTGEPQRIQPHGQ